MTTPIPPVAATELIDQARKIDQALKLWDQIITAQAHGTHPQMARLRRMQIRANNRYWRRIATWQAQYGTEPLPFEPTTQELRQGF